MDLTTADASSIWDIPPKDRLLHQKEEIWDIPPKDSLLHQKEKFQS